ncbi:hypothetical protein AcW1_005387 [Taiwanofungus camphoratus]|nr:hypothetical protein AcW2_004153 [Antrodia cinnamomea]KAI0928002.1 hypothetical protein AcW2_004153 [Antrodia cinnamomea]KAI0933601.1 hypothetical protein AcV5_005705 [Antrodia cinnamomea]KAI0948608.1 hypothetical protein AcV7_009301 [Antrodia cinnamomea]KAI0948609.1 hypothetical protein AcV7_009301 [Antrodia cinnamomea]
MNFDTNFVKCSKCAQEYNSRDRDHHDKVCRPGRTHRTAFPSSEPLAEGRLSPDASSECAVYGRSSTRKRNGGHPGVQIYHSSKGSHNVNSQDQLPDHLLQPPGAPLIGVGPQFNGFKHKYYDSPSQDRLDEHFVNYQDWSPDLQSWDCRNLQMEICSVLMNLKERNSSCANPFGWTPRQRPVVLIELEGQEMLKVLGAATLSIAFVRKHLVL